MLYLYIRHYDILFIMSLLNYRCKELYFAETDAT